MLIRSQCKMSLCNLENIDTISTSHYVGEDTKVEVSAYNQSEKVVLGYYKNKKRAIEVLDEICNHYKSNKNGVFQMPEV